jgi:hypothetical protein
MDVLDQLVGARKLIANPENWCIGKLSKKQNGVTSYCARGAIICTIHRHVDTFSQRDINACQELAKDIPDSLKYSNRPFSGYNNLIALADVATYNNEHDHKSILALFDTTITRLKREKVVADLLENSQAPVDAKKEPLETVPSQ